MIYRTKAIDGATYLGNSEPVTYLGSRLAKTRPTAGKHHWQAQRMTGCGRWAGAAIVEIIAI
jgi:hypothetical protein